MPRVCFDPYYRGCRGRVTLNFDGENMDTEQVTRHRQSLKRVSDEDESDTRGSFYATLLEE
jgi:hypothetical protein